MKLQIIILIFLFSTIYLIQKNPDCPFHVDYIQYTKSINNFYENNIIDDNVNGKYLYVYLMSIFIMPSYILGLSIFNSLVFITALFQILLIYLFHKYTKSITKTILMATTLTFLTFLGQAETIMLASVFLLLFFINRNKPYSEFFIMIASLIRIDYAIFYLFSRNKTAIIPISITLLQWLSGMFFLSSDLGINDHIIGTLFVLLMGFGMHMFIFVRTARPNKNFKRFDFIIYVLILIFLIVFLQFPSQKVFFFPIILLFMMFDFKLKSKKAFYWIIVVLIAINVFIALYTQINRAETCTAMTFYDFSLEHNESIYFGVFQPYLDYYGKHQQPPYEYQITIDCRDKDYMIAEDWRNSQVLYMSSKFCLEPYSEFSP